MPNVRSLRFSLLALVGLSAAGCATSAAPGAGGGTMSGPATAPEAEGIDMEMALARELPRPLAKARVAFYNGKVTGEIEADGAAKVVDGKPAKDDQDGEAAEVTVPLGSGGELTCLVYPESTEAARSPWRSERSR